MSAFVLRRFLMLIPLLLAISFLSFLLLSLAPGDYLTTLKTNRDISQEFIEQLRREYGLDRSVVEQYALWLGKAVRLDLGYSFAYRIPVWELITQRVGPTLLLSASSLLFAWSIAVPLGVLAALYKDSIWDRIASGLAFFALSLPELFLALLAVYFAASTGWFPVGGVTSSDFEFMSYPEKVLDVLYHLILPTIVLGVSSIAGLMRIMRASVLDTIRADFVTTARAKGVPEGRVLFCHVLRNAINPLITILGYSIAGLLSGALIVENIMSYAGLGQLTFEAFFKEDLYVVMASILIASLLLVVGNLIGDILLATVDPRIRLNR
jgi:peptide/nickel transport system permease protein